MTPQQAANALNMRQQQAPASILLQPERLLRDGRSRTCATSSLPGSASWAQQSCKMPAADP
eukprot:4700494-Alexandrium_andersonii.AAC.1